MTSQADTQRPSTARRAVPWMAMATLGYALLPLIIWFGVRDMSPFTFVALWYVVSFIWQGVFRQVPALLQERREQQQRDRGQLVGRGETVSRTTSRRDRSRFVIFDDLRKVKPKYLLISAASWLRWLLFALAVTLVEPVIATVVFEFWPVVFGLLTLTRFGVA